MKSQWKIKQKIKTRKYRQTKRMNKHKTKFHMVKTTYDMEYLHKKGIMSLGSIKEIYFLLCQFLFSNNV